jgi:hypothetical protein
MEQYGQIECSAATNQLSFCGRLSNTNSTSKIVIKYAFAKLKRHQCEYLCALCED